MLYTWDIFQTQKGRCHCLAADRHLGVSGIQVTFKAMNLVKKQLKDWSVGHFNMKRLERGCVCLVAQLCLILCDPMDCSPPGSSVHGDSPGKNTLLQGIFPTQRSNPGPPHYRQILYRVSHWGRVGKKNNKGVWEKLTSGVMWKVKGGWFKRIKYWWKDGVIHCIKFSQVRWEWKTNHST